MKIMSIAGARPNFMKLAAIASAVNTFNKKHSHSGHSGINHIIVHTGQHYDTKMSEGFFEELDIPLPDINLNVGSGTHAIQTAEIMKKFEPILLEKQPDVLLVVGDVNSTIACTLVASKIIYPNNLTKKRPVIAHVEAGLRSFDKDMPEEINRILTDALSDLFFVTEQSGVKNLKLEGIEQNKIFHVGNVMIDTLLKNLQKAEKASIRQQLNVAKHYALITLHRPSNVDTQENLTRLVQCVLDITKWIDVVFPLHPRTECNLEKFQLKQQLQQNNRIFLCPPLRYIDFLSLMSSSTLVVTDSGGIQEETTFLQVPCVTLRSSTERPVTVSEGSNYLTGTNTNKILETIDSILKGHGKKSTIPNNWDGKASDRIIDIIWNTVKRSTT